jgi:hypothetical protein
MGPLDGRAWNRLLLRVRIRSAPVDGQLVEAEKVVIGILSRSSMRNSYVADEQLSAP